MMFMAWAVLFPAGVFVARFFPPAQLLLRWWFHLHLLIQYLGVLFLLTGFIIAIETVAAKGESHFNNTHAILGLTTVLVGIVVPAFGQLTAVFWKPGGKSRFSLFGRRIFPELVRQETDRSIDED